MSEAPPTAAISISSLTKCFSPGASPAVDNISLDVAQGSFVAIVGGSGSGKTTLLKMINRLILPDHGQIAINGEANDAMPASLLRRRIGYVFQGIGLFPHMTVAENIAITPRLLGWGVRDIAARVDQLLDLVELPRAVATRFPSMLSGGQQQRVGFARALAARPRIMLMDEPFGALDPVVRDTLGHATRTIHDRLGMTTLMVTHDMTEAVLIADRIVVMKHGRLIGDGTAVELLDPRQHDDVRALMDMPRLQAERLRARLDGERG